MNRFAFDPTPIPGVQVVSRRPTADERGHFARLFCEEELKEAGWPGDISQINESLTRRRGSLRGLHYQAPPHADAKLVSCLRGEVFDVALDLRAGSPTFLRWHASILSAENGCALLIPPGCAHGFQALSDDALLVYCHSKPYAPDADLGINPFDPAAAIEWPLESLHISPRDRDRPMLRPDYKGISF